MKAVLAALFAVSLGSPAGATNLEGLNLHLQQNSQKYEDFTKKNKDFLKNVGFTDKDVELKNQKPAPAAQKEKDKNASSRLAVGSGESDKAALYGKPGGSAGTADLSGLHAAKQAGAMGGSITGVGQYHGSVDAFDPKTGERVASAEDADKVEDMYRNIIDHIVKARCLTTVAEPAFRALLWGAAALDLRDVKEEKWPAMIEETEAIWQGHVKAVRDARISLMEEGKIKVDLKHMPIIIYKPQDEVGATATWSGGIITVGDQYAGLGSSGKLAVLFHEDEHHWDNKTKGGLHNNHYSEMLDEPDDTPSGKNWTETLAYRNMGDFVDVLNLGWKGAEGGKQIRDQVASSF